MAPVACMPDMPIPRADATCPYARRRQRSHNGGISGRHRNAEPRQISIAKVSCCNNTQPASPVYAPEGPIDLCFPNSPESSLCGRIPVERDDQWIIVKRRQGLLNIVAKTIALVRRNHILEKKVEALRMETQSFISSVMNNPANKSNERREEPMDCSRNSMADDVVSSSTDEESRELKKASELEAHVEEAKRKVCPVTSTCNSTDMEHAPRTPELLDR